MMLKKLVRKIFSRKSHGLRRKFIRLMVYDTGFGVGARPMSNGDKSSTG